ncbi:ribosome-associated translation inhibitor RaiA [Porticoccaceae bacterium]|nr:ribosome-associated translation inhibitor RaiA [Porticoccaceae bacterium]
MQLTISGHQLDVTDSLRDYVTQKLSKLERHHDKIGGVAVVLEVEKLLQKAEATVHVTGAEFFADASNEDLYTAIDQLADKLDRQLIKHKEKHRGH